MGSETIIRFGAFVLCAGHKKIVNRVSEKLVKCESGHSVYKSMANHVDKFCSECGKKFVEEINVSKNVEEELDFNFSEDNKDGDLEPVLNMIRLDNGKIAYVSNGSDGSIDSIDSYGTSMKEMKDPVTYRETFMKELGKYIDILGKYHEKVELKVGIVVKRD